MCYSLDKKNIDLVYAQIYQRLQHVSLGQSQASLHDLENKSKAYYGHSLDLRDTLAYKN